MDEFGAFLYAKVAAKIEWNMNGYSEQMPLSAENRRDQLGRVAFFSLYLSLTRTCNGEAVAAVIEVDELLQ